MVTMLLTAALGMIWHAWLSAQDTTQVIGKKISVTESAVHGMAQVQRELRQASMASLSPLPAASLQYRIVERDPESGRVVDAGGAVRLGELRTLTRDFEDANRDGIRESQLVLITAQGTKVLANNLHPATAIEARLRDIESDAVRVISNRDRVTESSAEMDNGIWFEADAGGIGIRLTISGETRRNLALSTTAAETVIPRNP